METYIWFKQWPPAILNSYVGSRREKKENIPQSNAPDTGIVQGSAASLLKYIKELRSKLNRYKQPVNNLLEQVDVYSRIGSYGLFLSSNLRVWNTTVE